MVCILMVYVVSFRTNKMEAIRNKYRGAKFMKVADLPELKGEVGLVIANVSLYQSFSGTGTTCSKKTLTWEGSILNTIPGCGDSGDLLPDFGDLLPVQDRWASCPFLTP